MSIKVTGLEQLQKTLNDLKNKVESISGEQSVPISELLTPDFLATCSTFAAADEMFDRSGFKVDSQEDFAAIPDDLWEEFIRSNTSFLSWREMLHAAGTVWAKNKLKL
jgi:hypothetical protein